MQPAAGLHTSSGASGDDGDRSDGPPHERLWHVDPSAECAMAAVRVSGSGPDVVFVHGSLGDYRQWTAAAAVLRGRYRAVAISRRFHWPRVEPPPPAAYTYDAQRDDLLRFLRARGRPVHLVGHSYGAGIVLLAALADRALLRSIVLIEPAFNSLLPAEAPGLADELLSRAAMVADVRSRAAAGDHDTASRRLIDWVQGSGGEFGSLPAWVQAALLDNAVTAGPTVSHAPPHVACDDLRQLDVPTLVLAGERTRLYYRLIAQQVAAAIPRARAAELAGAAHMTIVERPVQTAALLASFFEEHAGSRER